eukprot:scaffold116512_cov87-Phaeocystis_antarctica.AAC.9
MRSAPARHTSPCSRYLALAITAAARSATSAASLDFTTISRSLISLDECITDSRCSEQVARNVVSSNVSSWSAACCSSCVASHTAVRSSASLTSWLNRNASTVRPCSCARSCTTKASARSARSCTLNASRDGAELNASPVGLRSGCDEHCDRAAAAAIGGRSDSAARARAEGRSLERRSSGLRLGEAAAPIGFFFFFRFSGLRRTRRAARLHNAAPGVSTRSGHRAQIGRDISRCIRVPNGRIDAETRSLAVTLYSYFRDACAARRPQHGRALG